ncbi:hypothetical protein Ocin01_17557 [Orchesella cincta]|uniref:Uncharacterized protein n=1 Tax=Orchesella cincta TaxID=48709 RepID=A0A1D2M840_ORCCI|nr:hypothetical protein Ocin01_17557 [Orchesella cincta]
MVQRAEYLGKAANAVNSAVFNKNSEKIRSNYGPNSRAVKQLKGEERMDCIAMSVSDNHKTGVISGNVKERVQYSRNYKKYGKYGLDQDLHGNAIKQALNDKAPAARSVDFDVVGNTKPPTDHAENARLHAEMQQVSYGVHGDSSTMGVSKPPCKNCDEHLVTHGFSDSNVGHPEGWRNDKPKNWEQPDPNNNPSVEKKFGVSKASVIVEKDLSLRSYTNVKVQNDSVKQHVARNITKSVKPRVNASIQGTIESLVEDIDREPGAYVVGLNACSGTYTGKRIPMAGAYARASTGDVQAHAGPCHVRANGPAAAAGAHASVLGVAAYANAEVARAEASVAGITAGVGLNFNTGASAGVDGVSASALGFGFSVGPSMAIRTPVADVACSIV